MSKGWIPPEYLNKKSLSEIANFVLMGQESSDSKINEIGIRIASEISNNYKPPIKTMETDTGLDNFKGINIHIREIKQQTQSTNEN